MSWISPIARALLKSEVGDTVEGQNPDRAGNHRNPGVDIRTPEARSRRLRARRVSARCGLLALAGAAAGAVAALLRFGALARVGRAVVGVARFALCGASAAMRSRIMRLCMGLGLALLGLAAAALSGFGWPSRLERSSAGLVLPRLTVPCLTLTVALTRAVLLRAAVFANRGLVGESGRGRFADQGAGVDGLQRAAREAFRSPSSAALGAVAEGGQCPSRRRARCGRCGERSFPPRLAARS